MLQLNSNPGQGMFPFWLPFVRKREFAVTIEGLSTLDRDIIGKIISVPSTAQELAEWLGQPRDTVFLALIRLREYGLVAPSPRCVVGDVECTDCNRGVMGENPLPEIGDHCVGFYNFRTESEYEPIVPDDEAQCFGEIRDSCKWNYVGGPITAFFDVWSDMNWA